ncbi:hypothetical protein IGI04_040489 [Brassica rapa subsp. trilocularis]|uniref:Uncharacterized protein n=1 Tax=Brassica rapa subsp. trilocularis TaxID=1813537 RepID=A0ABQ7KMZ7_BRACM|nr:hypothetical protein IGI04_040489 [Brassica rapa subsp. trilocularis]
MEGVCGDYNFGTLSTNAITDIVVVCSCSPIVSATQVVFFYSPLRNRPNQSFKPPTSTVQAVSSVIVLFSHRRIVILKSLESCVLWILS